MSLLGALGLNGLVDLRASIRGALHVKHPPRRYIGYQQLSSAAAATAYSLTVPTGATYADIHVTGANIYYGYVKDGTPSSTVGDTANIGDDIFLEGGNELKNFRAVRQGAANFKLIIKYHREGDYDEA